MIYLLPISFVYLLHHHPIVLDVILFDEICWDLLLILWDQTWHIDGVTCQLRVFERKLWFLAFHQIDTISLYIGLVFYKSTIWQWSLSQDRLLQRLTEMVLSSLEWLSHEYVEPIAVRLVVGRLMGASLALVEGACKLINVSDGSLPNFCWLM